MQPEDKLKYPAGQELKRRFVPWGRALKVNALEKVPCLFNKRL